ncbi:MAG: tetratricopeptide repeat protein, partial [Planctomycetota bacterium]
MLIGAGRPAEAIEHLDRAVALVPDQAGAWFARGQAQAALGQWDAALEDYQEAVRLAPNDATVYYHLAVALHVT